MALFFLVLGLEFSRQLKLGELRRWHTVATASAAALGVGSSITLGGLLFLLSGRSPNAGGSAGGGAAAEG
jgi:Na+/H+ antiporter NhaA